MRHKSLDMTFNTYGFVHKESLDNIAKNLGGLLSSFDQKNSVIISQTETGENISMFRDINDASRLNAEFEPSRACQTGFERMSHHPLFL